MENSFKRVFASLLAVMMIFTYMPTLAFADDENVTPSAPTALSYDEMIDSVAELLKENKALEGLYYDCYKDVERVVKAARAINEAIENGKPTNEEIQALYEQLVQAVDAYNKNVQKYLEKFQTTRYAAETFAKNVEDLVNLLKTGEATKEQIAKAAAMVVSSGESLNIAAYCDTMYGFFDEVTKDANSWIDGIDNDNIQAVLRDFVTDAVVLRDALSSYLPKAAEYLEFIAKYEDDKEVLALINSVQAQVEAAIAAGEEAQARFEAGAKAIIEMYEKIVADTEEWIKNLPEKSDADFQAIMDKFLEDAAVLRAAVDTYLSDVITYLNNKAESTDAAFRALMEQLQTAIAEAQAAFQKAAEGLSDKLMAELEGFIIDKGMEAFEYWTSDECEALLAEYGLSRDAIQDLVLDVIEYALGYSSGKTYSGISKELNTIKNSLKKAGYDAANPSASITSLVNDLQTLKTDSAAEIAKLKKALETAAASGTASSEDVSKLKNALKVVTTKTSIRKPKSKKRKVTAKWKAVKGVKVDGYQVVWKVGKKTYKKTAKAGATKLKSKKLKKKMKGKKAKVKVRAFVKVNGVTYYGKWSKVKKVKVK